MTAEKKEKTGAWKVLNSSDNKPIFTLYESIYHLGIFANLTGEKDKKGNLKIGYVASLGKHYRVNGKQVNKQITLVTSDLPKIAFLCNRAYTQFCEYAENQNKTQKDPEND